MTSRSIEIHEITVAIMKEELAHIERTNDYLHKRIELLEKLLEAKKVREIESTNIVQCSPNDPDVVVIDRGATSQG